MLASKREIERERGHGLFVFFSYWEVGLVLLVSVNTWWHGMASKLKPN